MHCFSKPYVRTLVTRIATSGKMPELEVREPAVISHDLIRKCIVPPRALDGSFLKPEKAEEKKAEMSSEHIVEVCLSFQNILKLDNLHGLQNLVKLQLDNNIISSIENIAHLTRFAPCHP